MRCIGLNLCGFFSITIVKLNIGDNRSIKYV